MWWFPSLSGVTFHHLMFRFPLRKLWRTCFAAGTVPWRRVPLFSNVICLVFTPDKIYCILSVRSWVTSGKPSGALVLTPCGDVMVPSPEPQGWLLTSCLVDICSLALVLPWISISMSPVSLSHSLPTENSRLYAVTHHLNIPSWYLPITWTQG